MTEHPKKEELHQKERISIFQNIQIAISLDWKRIYAFCLFYSTIHSLGLHDIIMDNVVSKNHFLRNVPMRAHCAGHPRKFFPVCQNLKITTKWQNVLAMILHDVTL